MRQSNFMSATLQGSKAQIARANTIANYIAGISIALFIGVTMIVAL